MASSALPKETNVLIVYNLDRAGVAEWTSTLDAFPGINRVAALPSFARVLAVFQTAAQAKKAAELVREQADVAFGPEAALDAEPTYLEPPDRGELLFISPPVSPLEGWVSGPEEEPNTRVHFEDDLTERLRQVMMSSGAGGSDLNVIAEKAQSRQPSSIVVAASPPSPSTAQYILEAAGNVPGIAIECVDNEGPPVTRVLPRTPLPGAV